MGKSNQNTPPDRPVWQRPSMSMLEADLAYFDARLAMLGEHPDSAYLAAQRRAFESLTTALKEMLEQLRGERKKLKRQKLRELRKRQEEERQAQEEQIEIFENTVVLGPQGENLEDYLEQLNDERIIGLDQELERIDDPIDILFEGIKDDAQEDMEPVYYIDVDSKGV